MNDLLWLEKLEKFGYVRMNSFLLYEQACAIRKQILQANHYKMWDLLTTPKRPLAGVKDRFSFAGNRQNQKQATLALLRHQFSFSFFRTNNKHAHQHGAKEVEHFLLNQLKAQIIPELGLSGEIRDSFSAKFIKDQFISYHTDRNAGQYGFIYQLTKGWQPKYGGQLELYPRKNRFYKTILQPTFNSLTLLKLDHPMPHSVRMLNNPAHKHRLTISGWLE